MITTTGADTDTAATAWAVRASAPSCPAGVASQAFPAAPAARPASRNDTPAVRPEKKKPPTDRASCAWPLSLSSPTNSAARCRRPGFSQAGTQLFRLHTDGLAAHILAIDPDGQSDRRVGLMMPSAKRSSTMLRPHPAGTDTSITREPVGTCHRSSHHSASSMASSACRPGPPPMPVSLKPPPLPRKLPGLPPASHPEWAHASVLLTPVARRLMPNWMKGGVPNWLKTLLVHPCSGSA